MAYHLLIQSSQDTVAGSAALQQTRQLLAEKKSIKQIFFYFHGIEQVLTMTVAAEWGTLIQSANQLKICKTGWVEKANPPLPNGFILSSLIDFFREHWQDQGILLQF